MASIISPQTALVYCMAVAAVADSKLKEGEIQTIIVFTSMLPAFSGYSADMVRTAAQDCVSLLDQGDGLDTVLGLVRQALPGKLRETAYALACDIVAVDGTATQEELRWLEMMRDSLDLDRLHAAAIERGSRARYMKL